MLCRHYLGHFAVVKALCTACSQSSLFDDRKWSKIGKNRDKRKVLNVNTNHDFSVDGLCSNHRCMNWFDLPISICDGDCHVPVKLECSAYKVLYILVKFRQSELNS